MSTEYQSSFHNRIALLTEFPYFNEMILTFLSNEYTEY
jgi:hypothetical protein